MLLLLVCSDRGLEDKMLGYFAVVVVAYLLGSVPFAFIWALVIGRRDLRKLGTGNISIYNSLYNIGVLPAALTFASNAAVGFGAYRLSHLLFPGDEVAMMLAVISVTTGAIWPIWLWFSGGRGTTTAGWATFFMNPPTAIAVLIVWFLALFLTRRTFTSTTIVYRALPLIFGLTKLSWTFMIGGLLLMLIFQVKHRHKYDDTTTYGLGHRFGLNKN